MKKFIILILVLSLCLVFVSCKDKELTMEEKQQIAEQFIIDGYKAKGCEEELRLNTSVMTDTTGAGRTAFMIEVEGEDEATHTLLIVEVVDGKAVLLKELF